MAMHNPPHPGEFIREAFLAPLELSPRSVALRLGVAPSTFSRLLRGQCGVSPEMALRLSKCLGRSAESWLTMQQNYDLWRARRTLDLSSVTPLVRAA